MFLDIHLHAFLTACLNWLANRERNYSRKPTIKMPNPGSISNEIGLQIASRELSVLNQIR